MFGQDLEVTWDRQRFVLGLTSLALSKANRLSLNHFEDLKHEPNSSLNRLVSLTIIFLPLNL